VTPHLLTPVEAAAFLGLTLATFRRHVHPHVPKVRAGRCVTYDPKDLETWAEQNKHGGPSGHEGPVARSTSASARTALASKSPREQAILSKLRSAPKRSTAA